MLQGFLFGLTVAAAIGPIALLIINTSVRFGLGAGVRSALGAATADLAYALAAAFAGGTILRAVAGAATEIRFAASIVLMAMGAWLAYSTLRKARREAAPIEESPRAYLTTLGLTIINPLTMLAFAAFIAQAPGAEAAAALLTAVAIGFGSLVVQLALALGGAWARPLFSAQPAMLTLNLVSAGGVFAFGLLGIALRS
jgi:threonine/homoserine/homoserine lactone efflux protein